jgi:hydroxymethylglutaryl-CoA synthase
MAGIKSCGAYIPTYRLSRGEISRAMGISSLGGERSVANFDEDTITMSVQAVRDTITDEDVGEIDALFFASTTPPYHQKESASTVATGADLKEDILTSDLLSSPRASVSALSLAMDRVKSGSASNILVAASDCRLVPGGSELEQSYGDGAAAVLVGSDNLIARFEAEYSVSDDFIDVWRTAEDKFVKSWEDRFIKTEGYHKNVTRAVRGLLQKYGLSPLDFQKAVIPAPDMRSLREMGKSLGFDLKTQIQDPLFSTVGDTGTAQPLLMLTACLEEAKPNDKILLVGFGDGAQALVFSVTEKIREKGKHTIADCVASKMLLNKYEEYLKFRSLMTTEAARRPSYPSSVPYMWRERNYFTRFHGSKCLNCGTEQYPRHRICYECKSKDRFEEIKLARRKGQVITYTKDYLFPSTVPPHVQAVVELEGGCRVYMMMTDVNPDQVKSEMSVQMVFRMLHDRGGFFHYGWKAKPLDQ